MSLRISSVSLIFNLSFMLCLFQTSVVCYPLQDCTSVLFRDVTEGRKTILFLPMLSHSGPFSPSWCLGPCAAPELFPESYRVFLSHSPLLELSKQVSLISVLLSVEQQKSLLLKQTNKTATLRQRIMYRFVNGHCIIHAFSSCCISSLAQLGSYPKV